MSSLFSPRAAGAGSISGTAARLNELRAIVEHGELRYEDALRKIRGEDPVWEREKAAELETVLRTIRQFNPDAAEGRVQYIMGFLKRTVDILDEPMVIIAKFEEAKAELQDIRERHKDSQLERLADEARMRGAVPPGEQMPTSGPDSAGDGPTRSAGA